LVGAIKKITSASGFWEVLQGVGTLCMWAGLLTLLIYVGTDVLKLFGSGSGTQSPSPSAS
jgi:hypothetical protein